MLIKKQKPATDIHDEIRAQFDKIAKLVPDIEDWQHLRVEAEAEAERTGDPVTSYTESHHVAAARAILDATKAMGSVVRALNRYCVEVTHTHEQDAHDALDRFFAPDRIDE
jgi:hypothetical protein